MNPRNPRNARDAALHHLALLDRKYPDLPAGGLSFEALEHAGMAHRDAALAIAIEQAALRYFNALVTIAQTKLTRPWEQVEPNIRAAILGGAAQLLLLERVPDHAAINESVEWTKRHARPKAGGLVNAVLRRIAELRGERDEQFDSTSRRQLPLPDGGALQLNEDVFDADRITRLAQQTSHPQPVVEQWIKRHGEQRGRDLALHSLVQPPIIIAGMPADTLPTDDLQPHHKPGFHVFTGDHGSLNALLQQYSDARVQDPASAAPVAATVPLRPELIIDYCAGRGTKTRQLAALHPNAAIIATDVNAERMTVLRKTFDDSQQVTVVESTEIANWSGRASLLVLDVPCSNTGVLARRVEAKHRLNERTMQNLVNLQRQIVADSLSLLTPDGSLLYCTCSIEPQENEQQIEWLIKWHDFDVSDQRMALPAGLPGETLNGYRDGGFFALTARR